MSHLSGLRRNSHLCRRVFSKPGTARGVPLLGDGDVIRVLVFLIELGEFRFEPFPVSRRDRTRLEFNRNRFKFEVPDPILLLCTNHFTARQVVEHSLSTNLYNMPQ